MFINSPKQFQISSELINDSLNFILELESQLNDDIQIIVNDSLDLELVLESEFNDNVFNNIINDSLAFELILESSFNDSKIFTNSLDFELIFDCQLEDTLLLNLVDPEPIITTVSGSDFEQIIDVRLYINNVKTEMRSATYSQSAENLGSELNIELVDTSIDTIPVDATFKFEIKDSDGWKTLLNNGKLDSRNLTRSWNNGLADTLSFSTFSLSEDKFAIAPRKNIIVYDSSRTEVDISDIDEIEGINGVNILTEARPYTGLTSNRILHIAFVEICGYSAIETDIPNYPILRCAFDFREPAFNSIWQFISFFNPEFIVLPGNKLRIVNTRKNVDLSLLEEIEITEDDYESLSLSSQSDLAIDGYVLQYQGNSLYGNVSTRLKQKILKNGEYGQPNYTETHINSYWREWKDDEGDLLDTKLLSETRTTFKGATTIEETITEFSYDGEGREKRFRKIWNARLQQFPSGEYSLINLNEILKQNFYKTDPKMPSRIYLAQSTEQENGMYVVDNDNPQLNQPYKRRYKSVADSGNLVEEMQLFTGPLQTKTETFIPIGNGQVKVYISGTNDLTDTPLEPRDEIRSGDISLNGNSPQPLEKVIWKTGANTTKGRPPQSFSIRELPLRFGIPLVQYILDNPNQFQGNIPVPGYNRNLAKGQYFKAMSRGEMLGKFVIKGFQIVMENLDYPTERSITSVLDVSQI